MATIAPGPVSGRAYVRGGRLSAVIPLLIGVVAMVSDGVLRLLRLREQAEAVEESMVGERARFARIAKGGPTEAVSAFNLFQSPAVVASRMAALLGPLDGLRVLEPSAGLGRLFHAATGGDWVLVENAPQCCAHLFELPARLVQDDFLACDVDRLGGFFDRVVMNPPFAKGRDCKHILHAFGMLKPGGRLVALCFNGSRQNAKLRPLVDSWELLPEASFACEGTRASVALVTWEKRGD